MKNYFKNLLLALLGSNPVSKEIERIKNEYASIMGRLKQMEQRANDIQTRFVSTKKQITNYQNQIENLRQRIKEKDELIARIKNEYQKRISEYNLIIDKLCKPTGKE
jgi:chromosome segregation ATPase